MIPALPAELIHAITDLLSDDIPSLKTCSMVHRRWTDIARQYIFQTLAFAFKLAKLQRGDCQRRFDALTDYFIHNPHVAKSVRTIYIRKITPNLVKFPSAQYKLSLLLSHLSNIRQCVIRDVEWTFVAPELRYAIHQLFARSPLRQLTTDELMIRRSDAIELFEHAKTLENLSLSGIRISHRIGAPTRNGATLSGLKTFTPPRIGLHSVYPEIITPQSFSSLSELTFTNTRQAEVDAFKNILRLPLNSLRRLYLHHLTEQMDDIRLPIHLTDLHTPECNTTILSRIFDRVNTPISLKRLFVSLSGSQHGREKEPISSPQPIDRTLFRPEFSQLESIHVRIYDWVTPWNGGSIRDDELFPLLSSSGRVKITVDWM